MRCPVEYRTTTHYIGNVEIVVHRPVLDASAHKKQEESLKHALTAYGKETMKHRG